MCPSETRIPSLVTEHWSLKDFPKFFGWPNFSMAAIELYRLVQNIEFDYGAKFHGDPAKIQRVSGKSLLSTRSLRICMFQIFFSSDRPQTYGHGQIHRYESSGKVLWRSDLAPARTRPPLVPARTFLIWTSCETFKSE